MAAAIHAGDVVVADFPGVTGPDEPGVDLWITQPDSVRECQQCKAENGGNPDWSMRDLAARGVLAARR